MTDNASPSESTGEKKQEKQTEAPKKSRQRTSSARSTASTQAKNGNGLLWFVTVLNFLLIASIVGAGYWGYTQWQTQQVDSQSQVQQQAASIQSQTEQNQQVREQLEQGLAQSEQSLDTFRQQLEGLEAQANGFESRLGEVSGRRPSDWLLAEADYLVRMAGRKLWLERDISTAILMLQSADSRLQDTADPSLLPVRQLLANDIQTLSQINEVSLTSVALALSGLSNQVNNLALALPKLPDIPEPDEQVSDSIWDARENLNKAWVFFKENLISYQPRTTPIRPLLSKQQQWLAREQLKLSLMHAQSAVMNEQATLYQQSLQKAMGILIEHYDLEQSGVVQFTQSVDNLLQTDITRDYPDSFQSAQALKDVLQKRVNAAFNNELTQL